MGRVGNQPGNKTLLMLFPSQNLGDKILVKFLGEEFKVTLFTFSKKDRGHFLAFKKNGGEEISVINLEIPIQSFWEKMTSNLKENILSSSVVIYFMERDFQKVRIHGDGEEWRINPGDMAQVKFAFVERILNNLLKREKVIWINLAFGSHLQSKNGQIYCNTRYGVTGFTKIMELTPHLQNIETVNICLTYFRESGNLAKRPHCSHCITEKVVDKKILLNRRVDVAQFLLEKVDSILSSTR